MFKSTNRQTHVIKQLTCAEIRDTEFIFFKNIPLIIRKKSKINTLALIVTEICYFQIRTDVTQKGSSQNIQQPNILEYI